MQCIFHKKTRLADTKLSIEANIEHPALSRGFREEKKSLFSMALENYCQNKVWII